MSAVARPAVVEIAELPRLKKLHENSLNEGHGFSRAVRSHSHEGFKGCGLAETKTQGLSLP
jgi:hypothetical protein